VERVSFDIAAGETLALVGESGCGKSTTGKALLNLVSWQGRIAIAGRDIAGLTPAAMAPVRRDIQMIFQDPFASLDPRMTVGRLVAEPLVIHRIAKGQELEDRVVELFRRVGLEADALRRHPHEFSGGQRQRICIARALTLNPKVIVADESVSALDVSVQAQVLDLLQELQDDLGLSFLFISHDMSVVEQVSHRVAVMYLGQIVELGPRAAVFENPRHDYTRRLLAAVPIADPRRRRGARVRLTGEVPSPVRALDFTPELVELKDVGGGHFAAV
jgi:peptide/nickel transport system ATP-binding protein